MQFLLDAMPLRGVHAEDGLALLNRLVLRDEQSHEPRQGGAVLPSGRGHELESSRHAKRGRHPAPLDVAERDAEVLTNGLGHVDAVRGSGLTA